MKILFFSLAVIAFFTSCKPEIEPFTVTPTSFCGCTNAQVDYLIRGGESASFSISPAVTPPTAVLGTRTTSSIRICETTLITLNATNGNGTTSKSGTVTKVDPIPLYNSLLRPCLGTDGIWSSQIDFMNPPPANTEILSVQLTTDRSGTLTGGGRSVEVRPGSNTFSEFAGLDPVEAFDFISAFLQTESCSQGSVSGDNRIRPREFTMVFTFRCRRTT